LLSRRLLARHEPVEHARGLVADAMRRQRDAGRERVSQLAEDVVVVHAEHRHRQASSIDFGSATRRVINPITTSTSTSVKARRPALAVLLRASVMVDPFVVTACRSG
jgi:hypothetical protein